MRKCACIAVAVVLVGFSVVLADEFDGAITKVEGNKITVVKLLKKKKSEPVILTVKDPIVEKGSKAGAKKYAIEGGLKNEMFAKIPEKGLNASLRTNDDGQVTYILIIQAKAKK